MNIEPLKLGFIGGATDSAIGASHRISSQMDGRWQISSACFSTDEQINIETAEVSHLPAERVYSDWQTLLGTERNELDAVVVLTPTPMILILYNILMVSLFQCLLKHIDLLLLEFRKVQ